MEYLFDGVVYEGTREEYIQFLIKGAERYLEKCLNDLTIISHSIDISFNDIEKFYRNVEVVTFSMKVLQILEERKFRPADVCKYAQIDRKLFAKLKQKDYHPSKNTALSLAIGLRLNTAECKKLLELAGYCISPCSEFDKIVEYCLLHKIYDMFIINELLEYYTGRNLSQK